ncbi:MAG: 23S rRNA (adenine(2503)-C(2))-methyltransferase RlmN [Bacteroidales bacterium]|nr:23S rRNA (adenine(2503)-C(2))-methyltransferase RlmN [Bacteroidales bacterium]
MDKETLLAKTPDEMQTVVDELGLPKFTAKQLLEWIYQKRCASFDAMSNLSKKSRELLAERYEVGLHAPLKEQVSTDGTKKYLFAAGDRTVEAAYIPDRDRATLCVSSQVGCQMDCLFCATGKQGFEKNLTAAEIVNQILSLPEFDTLTNIVFMGMGEPLNNYDNLMRSLAILTEPWALGWSPTRITVSTCGVIPNLKRFLTESKCNLAISMHSPFHDERLKMMPIEKNYPITEVIHLVKQHDWHGQRRLSFEYIVFKELNDTRDHVKELARLLGSLRCRVNLIRYHAVPGIPLKSPDNNTMTWFRDALNDKGIIATIRASRGQDIDAACGLLSTKNQ